VHWVNSGLDYNDLSSGETFDAFDNDAAEDEYDLAVNSELTALGTNWTFLNWDDGTTSATLNGVQVDAPTTKTAYYKGIMRSDDAGAYINSGQRKVIRLSSGDLIHVYESMNKIWLEKSANNGDSWTLINNGEPLNSSAYEGLSPSLCVDNDNYSGNYFYVVFQEKDNYVSSRLKLQYYKNGISPYFTTILSNTAYQNVSSDMHPVIAKSKDHRLIVVWKVPNVSPYTAGLYYHYISHSSGSSTLNYLNGGSAPLQVNNTGSSSFYPSVAVLQFGSHNPFHLVWQHGNIEIRYCELTQNNNYSAISQNDYAVISSGSGFSSNYRPTVTFLKNYYN
jgi:hypothetical protein